MVRVNGENLELSGKTVSEMLSELDYIPSHVAVELNEQEIVPREEYGKRVLKDGDSVEVVRFVGGGSEFYAKEKSNE